MRRRADVEWALLRTVKLDDHNEGMREGQPMTMR
jgi:hypothetical protein